MSIGNAIIRSFEKKYAGGWEHYPRMYWAIDLHGVILRSTYREGFGEQTLNEDCLEVLRWLSNRYNMVPILFTASTPEYIKDVIEWLESIGVYFEYVNSNPEVKSKGFCNVEDKFYFDILIDDKAGFELETDWKEVKTTLQSIGEWDEINSLIRVCAWCGKLMSRGLEGVDLSRYQNKITHGICPDCYAKEMNE